MQSTWLRHGLLAPGKASPKARLPQSTPVAEIDDLLHELDESRAEG